MSNPAADLRQFCEDVQARHGDYYFSRIEPMGNFCNACGEEWPCDAYLAAQRLEQAVTALEEAKQLAFHTSPLLTLEDSKRAYDPLVARYALEEFRAALRAMEEARDASR